jgi:hypothetical protein
VTCVGHDGAKRVLVELGEQEAGMRMLGRVCAAASLSAQKRAREVHARVGGSRGMKRAPIVVATRQK